MLEAKDGGSRISPRRIFDRFNHNKARSFCFFEIKKPNQNERESWRESTIAALSLRRNTGQDEVVVQDTLY